MAGQGFSFEGFLARLAGAIALVLATYNPEGYSYYHWALARLPEFSVLKGFIGVVLLIGWAIYLRATVHSLGAIGGLLAVAFFGTLLWLVWDSGIFPKESVRFAAYLVLLLVAGVLSIGISWSHVRRRITGQIDVDDND